MVRALDVITLLLLFVLLGIAGYLLYDRLPRESIPFVPFVSNTTPPNYTSSVQFYPNMRFKEARISYFIEEACSEGKRTNAKEAFEALEDSTILEFYESSNAEITVICSELAPQPERRRHFVAGEGGPTEILNGTLYSVIVEGTFSLYRDETCSTPHIALHETLHVLGFDHNDDPRSILYPTLNCEQTLDDYLIEEINRLYSTPSQADLLVHSVSGSKAGRYISFEIQIANQGLQDAEETSLRVYAEGAFVKEFELQVIPIGARKILTVTNLNVGRRAERIEFRIDETNQIEELNELNNREELIVTAP